MTLSDEEEIVNMDCHAGKENAVHAVEEAAVTWHETTRLLCPGVALEHRFDQVAELPENADKHPQQHRLAVINGKLQRPVNGEQQADGYRPDKPGGGTFPGLLRADARRHPTPAEGPSNEISRRIRAEGSEYCQEDPVPPRFQPQINQITQQQTYINNSTDDQDPGRKYFFSFKKKQQYENRQDK